MESDHEIIYKFCSKYFIYSYAIITYMSSVSFFDVMSEKPNIVSISTNGYYTLEWTLL
jgi:hypothetical protein